MYQDIKDVTSNNDFQMLHLIMFLNDIKTVKCNLQATMLINAQKICANLERGSQTTKYDKLVTDYNMIV